MDSVLASSVPQRNKVGAQDDRSDVRDVFQVGKGCPFEEAFYLTFIVFECGWPDAEHIANN